MVRKGRKPGPAGGPSVRLRVAEEVRQKLAQLLLRELDDPRLDGVHLTRVEMTGDLSKARVFWRVTPGAALAGPAAEALRKAGGFLRGRLARAMRIKHVPELDFMLDELVDTGARIEGLLAGLAVSRIASASDDEE